MPVNPMFLKHKEYSREWWESASHLDTELTHSFIPFLSTERFMYEHYLLMSITFPLAESCPMLHRGENPPSPLSCTRRKGVMISLSAILFGSPHALEAQEERQWELVPHFHSNL